LCYTIIISASAHQRISASVHRDAWHEVRAELARYELLAGYELAGVRVAGTLNYLLRR
jgi:hypothetical protein